MRDCDHFALATVLGSLLAVMALFLATDARAQPRLAGQLLAAGVIGAVIGGAMIWLAMRR